MATYCHRLHPPVSAFTENVQYIDGVKIGVLAGSLLSTIFGYLALSIAIKK
jgi:NhaA family Na+:H+ antiporter